MWILDCKKEKGLQKMDGTTFQKINGRERLKEKEESLLYRNRNKGTTEL